MKISLIAAMDENRVIGIDNRLPWKLPADMQWFRQHTLGKPVLMGRTTFDSLGRKPLPGRMNVVLSRQTQTDVPGVHFVKSVDEAFALLRDQAEIMVIGGASFYEQLLPLADTLYLTIVHHRFTGDAYFPDYTQYKWHIRMEKPIAEDEKNLYAMTFYILERAR
jgi:dihydrofolate reductase